MFNPSPKSKFQPTNSGKKKPRPRLSDKRKRKREMTKVLKSFNASPGFHDTLEKLLPKEFKHCSDEVACLLLFIIERQNIWFSKYHNGKELTNNISRIVC